MALRSTVLQPATLHQDRATAVARSPQVVRPAPLDQDPATAVARSLQVVRPAPPDQDRATAVARSPQVVRSAPLDQDRATAVIRPAQVLQPVPLDQDQNDGGGSITASGAARTTRPGSERQRWQSQCNKYPSVELRIYYCARSQPIAA